uniref:Iron-sulfur cluster repair di-iron protein n=1 Tax=Roseihalotalea indica TaxID=2867963 RepID=A0AA49JFX1_9BACT|nr:iron-sulfur cluster repair di-iron protein [Tunicatimonas sp. TK19036]
MNINTHKRIGELVDENYAYASVLYYFGIKFYDYDEKTLEQACQERSLNVDHVIRNLEAVYEQDENQPTALSSLPVDIIIAYLKHTHFLFIKERLPYLSKLIHHLPKHQHQLIVEDLQFVFPLFVEDLIHHIYEEEDEFFSYVLALQKAAQQGQSSSYLYFGMEKYSIQEFAMHHDMDDDEMEGIRQITNDYSTEGIESLHLRVIYAELQKFERELCVHASVENEILFPKALMLEKQVQKTMRAKVRLN